MSYEILRADSRNLPIESGSVDLVVTSPPYFALRNYIDKGEAYDGQIGSLGSLNESDSQKEYLEGLWEVTAESARVLKDSGNIWVNLGDKYNNKHLLGMPWRYAIGVMDNLGLVLRDELIWEKSSCIPTAAKDRLRRTHETWFHFVKKEGLKKGYYANLDEIRIKPTGSSFTPGGKVLAPDRTEPVGRECFPVSSGGVTPHSVWIINGADGTRIPAEDKKRLGIEHFAAFPQEWPRRLILGFCPPGGVVLDPFGGSGTTAGVADALGCHGITVDLSEDYCRLAQWRIEESGHFSKVMEKTEKERAERLTWGTPEDWIQKH